MAKQLSKTLRDAVVTQALKEIDFARTYKQGRIQSWQKNEDMYYGRKRGVMQDNSQQFPGTTAQATSQADVELGKMQSFVNTILSKIDNALTFKYIKGTMADLTRAKYLNALKEKDANIGDWNFKDLLGKKQGVIYGRAIYSYSASSVDGKYKSNLRNIDVYDFLIDPSAGGYDVERALYLGMYGVKLNKEELKNGAKNGIYLKEEVKRLVKDTSGNNDEVNQEEQNKQNRYSNIASPANRTLYDADIYKFWEWFTTYKGKRYYLVVTETGGVAIRVEELEEVFLDGLYPIWTWASFPDLTEFWTPSFCDYVREIYMAQNISINQMLDNAERRNKPQRFVDTDAIENTADLAYRRNGIIRLKAGRDGNKAFKIVETPEIQTPIEVYNLLDNIAQLESGVTAAAQGVAKEDKVGIYEGNQAATADRFGLLNKSYSQGYKRFAVLYKNGIEDHLTKKTSIKILGVDGLDKIVYVNKRDLKPSADYDILVEASNAESQSDAIDKKNKLTFLDSIQDPLLVNPKTKFEIQAQIAGFSDDEIRMLLDTSDYNEAELIAEADRDMELMLNGKVIEPNLRANNAYRKRIFNYMMDHKEDMNENEFILFTDYMERIEEIVMKNEANQMQNKLAQMGIRSGMGGSAPTGSNDQIAPEPETQTEDQLTVNEPEPEESVPANYE